MRGRYDDRAVTAAFLVSISHLVSMEGAPLIGGIFGMDLCPTVNREIFVVG